MFLLDSGAIVSVVPPRNCDLKFAEKSNLLAANGTRMTTYGERLFSIDCGLRRSFEWKFIIANVNYPIIGADFLYYHNLTLNLFERKLIDNLTKLSSTGVWKDLAPSNRITSIAQSKPVFNNLLQQFKCLTTNERSTLPPSIPVKHYIDTGNATPYHCRPRPLPVKYHASVKESLQSMLKEGTIRPSSGEWASPAHVVPKKDNSWRVVGDYRYLNSVSKSDVYPLPFINDFSVHLHGKKIFSRIDLKSAFLQMPINEQDIVKTAVCTPFGNYEFLYMNYGLKGASATFQRYINTVLWDLKNGNDNPVTFFAYIDDILVASDTEEDHVLDLRAIFTRLADNNLKINELKCSFGVNELDFLGHRVSKDGLLPLPEKVEAISSFKQPLKVNGLRRFIGMLNYYRRYIAHAAEQLTPLFNLINKHSKSKKNETLKWSDDTTEAFNHAKNILTNVSLLAYPNPHAQLSLACDASGSAIGAVLQQSVGDVVEPIAFFSSKLSQTQAKYSTFGRELLAIFRGVKHFRNYIEGREITIYTDHKPIVGAISKRQRDLDRETRQLMYISQFTTNIKHISGEQNKVADALSRQLEDLECENSDLARLDVNAVFQHTLYDRIAEAQKTDLELADLLNNTQNLKLTKINDIYCEEFQNCKKPYVPQSLRREVFAAIHDVSHPGLKSTLRQVRARFVWPRMNRDVKMWARQCTSCQRSKILRHNQSPLHSIKPACAKFSHIFIDIVGPLPSSNKFNYLLTIIDLYSRWTEAIPLSDTTSQTVCQALISNWVARFGVPESISSDRGPNFESKLFSKFSECLGIKKIRTTAYHPQANLVERFHRRLKEAIRATATCSPHDWLDRLPLIMLALRTSVRDDNQPAPSDIVYGCSLKLPIDLMFKTDESLVDCNSYVDKLKLLMQSTGPVISRPSKRSSYIDPNLRTCKYVFIRNENKRGLNPVYNGPYIVLDRTEKYFKIDLNTRVDNVSIDRLKAAHTDEEILKANTSTLFNSLNSYDSSLVSQGNGK